MSYKITRNDINIFYDKNETRDNNDSNNKIRENIISDIINKKIPDRYYRNKRWKELKNKLELYIEKLSEKIGIEQIENIYCEKKAGRCNNYDFEITINNNHKIKVEFKFGTSSLYGAPQFSSPMCPSKYLKSDVDTEIIFKSFEEYLYDTYLIKIAEYGKLEIPNKDEYCKKIHSNKVECMKFFKEKYKNNKKFKDYCKKMDKKGISEYIKITEINKEELSNYLIESQKDKHYMCYKDGEFYYDKINENILKIKNIIKKENTNYIYETESGMKLEIKLRFKNGCGLLFPAFQIKRKVPLIKELKEICKKNNINSSGLKKNIMKRLDVAGIIY